MTRKRLEEWTCDSCHKVEAIDADRTSARPGPVGWTCFAFNWGELDPSWDHDGWRRFSLCVQCRNMVTNGASQLANFTHLEPRDFSAEVAS